MSRFLAFRAGSPELVDVARVEGDGDRLSAKAGGSAAEGDADDPLLSFQAEAGSPGTPGSNDSAPRSSRPPKRIYFGISAIAGIAIIAIGAGVAAVIGGAIAYVRIVSASHAVVAPAPPASATATVGTATVDAHPPGMVTIDGIARGSTPLVISLPVGTHAMAITVGSTTRSLPLTIEAGTTIKQDVEFPVEAAEATGRLEITSEPSGAEVTIDGAASGVTPLTIGTMAPGQHKVVITKGATVIRRTVKVEPGATASIAGSMAEIDAAGWITLKAPISLDVLEDGQIIGTTVANRLMLPAGAHRLELKNTAFEVGTTIPVQIVAGKTASVTVSLPNGLLSVNALPWANVSIDGQEVGSTPLANLSLPVGTHEVIWRNPQLGERRRSIDVTARSPVRIGMDFAK
jgi:hypothetical protein